MTCRIGDKWIEIRNIGEFFPFSSSLLPIEGMCIMQRGKGYTSSQQNQIITIQGLQQGHQYKIGKDFLLRDSGLYYVTIDQQSGMKKAKRIAEPLFIEETTRNIDKEEVNSNLVFKYKGHYLKSSVDRGQITVPNELMKLNKKGVEIPHEYSKIISTYLREQEKDCLHKEVYSKIGFHLNEKKQWEYRHFQIIPYRSGTTSYDEANGTFQLVPKGNFKAWLDMIKEEVQGYTPLEFILVVGLSAPLVGYLSQVIKIVETIFVNLNNKTTVGKTTAAMLAVSAFGDPNPKSPNSLVQDWSSTANSIIESFDGNKGIPIVLDELSMNKDKELTSMYYSIVAGKGKGRLTDQIQQRKKGTWATTVLSTGEISAFLRANENGGVKVRIKEYSNVYWTKSAKNADNIRGVIQDNYGHAGIIFVEHLFKVGLEKIEHLWKEWKNQVENALPQTEYTSRVAKDYAVIMAATTLANEALGLNLSEENILDFIVEHEEKASVNRNTGRVAYEKIKQIIIEHQSNFRQDGQISFPQKCWGKVIYHNDFVEFAILKHILEQQLMENGFENINTVTNDWKKDGLLITEGDRKTKRTKICTEEEKEFREKMLGGKVPKKAEDTTYNLKIPKEEIEDLLARRRTAESFCNDPDIEQELG